MQTLFLSFSLLYLKLINFSFFYLFLSFFFIKDEERKEDTGKKPTLKEAEGIHDDPDDSGEMIQTVIDGMTNLSLVSKHSVT